MFNKCTFVNMVSFLNKSGKNCSPLVRKQDLAKRSKVFELIKQTLGLFYKNIYFKFSGLILIHNSVTDIIGNWSNILQFRSNNNLVKPNGSQAISWVWCSAQLLIKQLIYSVVMPVQGCHLAYKSQSTIGRPFQLKSIRQWLKKWVHW